MNAGRHFFSGENSNSIPAERFHTSVKSIQIIWEKEIHTYAFSGDLINIHLNFAFKDYR